NGSANDIAGITNVRGNGVGMMPHPVHATEEGCGPDTALARRSGPDGLTVFTSAIAALAHA
ncbi:MAG: phosphoribosylformylglycinamidine synthase subunit PurQ, partial [Rhodoglobus sp.]|nr:phosphoribosylformylglycinamidine synthase subunit PurQ [Rhodoglobus sp.]